MQPISGPDELDVVDAREQISVGNMHLQPHEVGVKTEMFAYAKAQMTNPDFAGSTGGPEWPTDEQSFLKSPREENPHQNPPDRSAKSL